MDKAGNIAKDFIKNFKLENPEVWGHYMKCNRCKKDLPNDDEAYCKECEPIVIKEEKQKKEERKIEIEIMEKKRIELEREEKTRKEKELKQLEIDCFSNFKVNDKNIKAYELSKAFIHNDKGLFLFGGVGTGKTMLAKSIYKYINESGSHCNFVIVPELLLDIRESFRNDTDYSERDIVNNTTNTDVLILDDFGAEKVSEFTIETLYLIFCRVETNNIKLLITSNMSLKQLSAKMCDRITSRIAGFCDIRKLDDYDHRLNK